ncbi:MAG TPA: BON domain-containing protein [Bryobacteraceae bacterium]|nr:BON domain-containing protein [Bryobacteraceae bacterium]
MRKMLTPFVAVAVVLSPSFLFAQKNNDSNIPYVHGPASESRLLTEIRHQLVMLPYYSVFDDLAFRVDGGTVTLLGAVTRPTLKSSAENVVKRIEGVTQVNNQIEVLPLSPMDDQIRRAMVRAIYGDPNISTRYAYQALPSIHIIVKNGNVVLKGLVANQFDKTLVYTRASSVPNVFKVVNELQIENSK